MLGVSVEADFKLSTQLAGTACILCLGAGTTYLFMQLVGLFMPWRVSEEAEALGLNISEHGAKDSLGELVSAIQNNLSSNTPDKRLPEDPSNELNVISAKVNELLSSISAGHDALKKEKDSVSATLANVERLNNAIATHTAVSTTDLRGKITFVNKKFCELSGYSEHKLLHSSHRLLNSNHHDTAFWQQFWGVLNKGESWNGKICNRKRDGEHYWVEATVTPNFHGKQLIGYISMQTEIKA